MPSFSRRFREVVPSVPTSSNVDLVGTYSWHDYLDDVLERLAESEINDDRCSAYVVPADAFYQAPLANLMGCIGANVELEVRLSTDYCNGTKEAFFDKPLYWFASIIKVAGYRLLVRYEGMVNPGDVANDFWVHISSTDVERVGNVGEKSEGILVPPEAIVDRRANWKEYAYSRMHSFRTLPFNWSNYRDRKIMRCKFKKGDRVELLDSLVSMRTRPALITDVIGDRVLVKLSEKDLDGCADMEIGSDEEDPQISGVWMEQDSPLLFYVGWSIKVGYSLHANDSYMKHAAEIAHAIQMEKKELPLAAHDAHPDLFNSYKDNVKDVSQDDTIYVEWEKGMKLEVLDPLDTWKELRVGTVLEILSDGYLKIGFDGEDMVEDTVPFHCSSPLLFPAGYADKYGISLKHPGEGDFNWEKYLHECNAVAAPKELFEDVEKLEGIEKFHIGAKLEAVDLCEPILICVGTVMAHKGRLLRVKYDGWDDSYDQLFDYRSNNIYPLGWCEMYGHKLEPPRVEVKKKGKPKK